MLATALQLVLTMAPPVASAPPMAPTEASPEPSSPPAPAAEPPVAAEPATDVAPAPATSADPMAVLPVGEPSPAPGTPAPSVATAPAADSTPLDPTTTEPPVVAPELPRQRYRGIGMFVAGGLLGAVGFPFKIIATSSDTREARAIDRGLSDPDVCVESCYVGPLFNVIAVPLLVSSVGLLGGGMTMHGRWAAHRDAGRGRLRGVRRSQLMIGLGLGAIGAGIGAFIGSRVALRNAESEGQYVARRELGWWAGLTGLYAGSGLTGYGVGYEAGRNKLAPRVQARVSPMLSPQVVGLGVSGSF